MRRTSCWSKSYLSVHSALLAATSVLATLTPGASALAEELVPTVCSPRLSPVDSSRPTTVVGSGYRESCTEQALQSAISRGGVVTFHCGGPATIAITRTLEVPTDRDTTIDGGDLVTLDGLGSTQLLRAVREDFQTNDRVLTVQRIALVNGRDAGRGFQARQGDRPCAWGYKEGGGGAITARDMNVHAWGVRFENNRGPELGPDVAGGAIFMMGAKRLVVENSIFRGNAASNGGAVGMLQTSAELSNVLLVDNHATGTGANFGGASGCPTFNHDEQGGAGGVGGAFSSDGFDAGDRFCGVHMADNTSNDLGGAVFRSAYWGIVSNVSRQAITWEQSRFERNRSAKGGGGAAYVNNSLFTLRSVSFSDNDSGPGDGGALKITGLTVRADDLQFSGNRASWGGGVAHWQGGPEGSGSASNVRFTGNVSTSGSEANDAVGDFPR